MSTVVVGTAGHIDHGKSALIRALTGIDPDTFPDVAKEAEGKCPVSNALRGSLAIEVNASVK